MTPNRETQSSDRDRNEEQHKSGSSWLKQEVTDLLTTDWPRLVEGFADRQSISRTVSASLLRNSVESAQIDQVNWSNRDSMSMGKNSDLFREHKETFQINFASMSKDIFKKHKNIHRKRDEEKRLIEPESGPRGEGARAVSRDPARSSAKDIMEKYNKKISSIFSGKYSSKRETAEKQPKEDTKDKSSDFEFLEDFVNLQDKTPQTERVSSIMDKYNKKEVKSATKREAISAQKKRIPSKFRAKGPDTQRGLPAQPRQAREQPKGRIEPGSSNAQLPNLMSFDRVDFKEESSQFLSLSPMKQKKSFLQTIKSNRKKTSNLKKFKRRTGKNGDSDASFVETLKKKFEPAKIVDNSSNKLKLYRKQRASKWFPKSDLRAKLTNKKFSRKKFSENALGTSKKSASRAPFARNTSLGSSLRLDKIKKARLKKQTDTISSQK